MLLLLVNMYGSWKRLKKFNLSHCGTGIGGGAVVEGKLVHGMLHPEMGHIFVNRHPEINLLEIVHFMVETVWKEWLQVQLLKEDGE